MTGKTVDRCVGCVHALEAGTCRVYIEPGALWRRGYCPMATHVKREVKTSETKLNPLKASKRGVKQ